MCVNLKTAYIPNSVTSIGMGAFENCKNLEMIDLPTKIENIPVRCFHGCSSLTSIQIPRNVVSIEKNAFWSCSRLIKNNILERIESIANSAFSDCSSLLSINVDTFNDNYSSDDGVLFDKAKETLIKYPDGKGNYYMIPDSVRTIKSFAFSRCRSLTSVKIPSSVKKLRIMLFTIATCKRFMYIMKNLRF